MKKLELVTLTVNNLCNMNCPHCYLQLNKKNMDWAKDEIIENVLNSNFKHLAISGKEPLVNQEHVNKLISLSEQVKESGKSISIITNGKNLHFANKELLSNLKFIDISFDGGEKTYEKFRMGNYSKLKEQIRRIYNSGFKKINALHSVHSGNIENIDDMMTITKIIPFERIMFTPYIVTENFGENSVAKITIEKLFEKLSNSKTFMETNSAIVNIDTFHLEQARLTPEELIKLADKFNLTNKLVLHGEDLLPYGVVRITYDGKVLSPSQSLNPKKYSDGLELKDFKTVNDAWNKIMSTSQITPSTPSS